jgi:uncharacterized membrane protein YtjA (UPF0391 family)
MEHQISRRKESLMLRLAVLLLVIAIVAAVFGFGGFVSGAIAAAKLLFVIFLIGAVIAFLLGRRTA